MLYNVGPRSFFMRNVALCLTSFVLLASSTLAETRHALVIGNNGYPGNELRNAVNDATSVYGALKEVGYDSTLLIDADRVTLSAAIDRFVDTLRPGDTALLYYAGHGLQVSGENYLVPIDFKAHSPDAVRDQGYSLSTVLERFTEHGARTQVVILDSCRDNPFLGTRSAKGGWSALGTSAGTFLAFGTSPGSTASDDPVGSHGLFTKYLLPLLTQSDLDIEDMFRQVREGVIRESHAQQVPWTASSLIGSFHVRPDFDAGNPRIVPFSEVSNFEAVVDRRSFNLTVNTGGEIIRSGDSVAEGSQIGHAITLARSSRFAEAIDLLQDVLSVWPESSAALRLLGLLFHCVGRDTEALATFDRALKLNGRDASAAAYQCAVQGLLKLAGAQATCELAIRGNPSAETYLNLAATLTAIGDDQSAATAVK